MSSCRFKGWIPTVSGSLSFSTFGEASHSPRAVSVNRSDGTTRYLICYRGKNISDVLPPFRWIPFFPLRGKVWMCCLATMESHDGRLKEKLTGRLYVFTDRKEWKRTQLQLDRAQKKLRRYNDSYRDGDLKNFFESEFNLLFDNLTSRSSFNVMFEVLRTGETTIIAEPPDASPSGALPGLGVGSREIAHTIDVVSAQLYYFLRDISHRHQHHDSATDTILSLYRVETDDDDTWKYETLYSLYRRIIQFKRSRRISVSNSSLGVMSYAQTFSTLFASPGRDGKALRDPPFFNYEAVRQSIQAIDEELSRSKSISDGRRARLTSVMLPLIALIVSVLGLLKLTNMPLINVHVSPIIQDGLAFILEEPGTSIGIFLLISILVYYPPLTSYRFLAHMTRWVLRLFHALNWQYMLMIFMALGTAVVAAIIVLLQTL